jgi:hypothetical protein
MNLSAKLENCTEEKQRSVISFLRQKIYHMGKFISAMCDQYGGNALSHRVVDEWIEMFKNGCMSVTDAECLGHPITATTTLILQNRAVTVDELAKQLNISIGSAYSVP